MSGQCCQLFLGIFLLGKNPLLINNEGLNRFISSVISEDLPYWKA